MRLVTFQSMDALNYLKEHKYLICNNEDNNNGKSDIIYEWVISEMNKRIKNNTEAKSPLWCWVKCDNDICPKKHKGKRVEGYDVKITFNKDERDVFITDFRRYSFLLNNIYIPNDLKEKEAFYELLKEKNVSLEDLKAYVRRDKYSNYRKDKDFMDVLKVVQSSFDRCITKDSDILQGCIWKIEEDEIESIEILDKEDGYVYGSLNYLREDGKRRNWIEEYYSLLK